MKKKFKMILTAVMLSVIMAVIQPVQMIGVAAASAPVYVSEVKVGMGETSDEAAAELLAEGFTILCDPDGSYADLNYKAGTSSGMKAGPTEKIVYLGYKTTTNPKEAITDLAVMNMNGGYSTEDYDTLMANHMEGEIKPFMNRFIAALNEYRENYNKPADSLGHKRADFYRKMLNKLTDDDTGGKPLGDLLLNKTKYEIGDDAYNALSAEEKNNHCDILTLLMQGNGRAVFLLETLISKATDSSDNTWVDRLLKISFDDLKAQVKEDCPWLNTEADIIAEMDKRYNDTARAILDKWSTFGEVITSYDDNVNEVLNSDLTMSEEDKERLENIGRTGVSTLEDAELVVNSVKNTSDIVVTMQKAAEATVIDFLNETDYEDGTLLEFFDRDRSELDGENIRELYPIAAALSPGQLAGLDFLTITDLVSMAIISEDGLDTKKIDELGAASVYQDVDRAIYEPGGVALTTAAMRNAAREADTDKDFALSELGIVFWCLTGVSLAGAVTSIALNSFYFASKLAEAWEVLDGLTLGTYAKDILEKGFKAAVEDNFLLQVAVDDVKYFTTASKITYYLGIGFTVLTAVLAGVSIYLTVSEMLEYYKVTFVPIPKYMVDEADITEVVDGKTIMKKNQTAYYKVVQCNRKPGSSEVEQTNYSILGTANDLNGDVGKQWLALYSVKYEEGRPILADSLKVVKGSSELPDGYETGIHRFGEGAALNLTSKYYCYNDKPDGTYVYFKQTNESMNTLLGVNASSAGSLFSGGSLALGGGIGMIVGGGIVAMFMTSMNKKKREIAVPA